MKKRSDAGLGKSRLEVLVLVGPLQRLIPCKKAQLKHNHDFIQSPAFFFTMFHHFSAVAWREVGKCIFFLKEGHIAVAYIKLKDRITPQVNFFQ